MDLFTENAQGLKPCAFIITYIGKTMYFMVFRKDLIIVLFVPEIYPDLLQPAPYLSDRGESRTLRQLFF